MPSLGPISGQAIAAVPVAVAAPVFQPGTGTLALTGATPLVEQGVVHPGTGALTLTVSTPRLAFAIRPGAGTLTLTAAAPIRARDNPRLTSTGALALTGAKGTFILGRLQPGTGTLTLVSADPGLLPARLQPGAAHLVLTEGQAAKDFGAEGEPPPNVQPGTGTLTLTGGQARLSARLSPGTAVLTLTGSLPAPGSRLAPSTGRIYLTPEAPLLPRLKQPGTGTITLAGRPVNRTGPSTLMPGTGALVLQGQGLSGAFQGATFIATKYHFDSSLEQPADSYQVDLAGTSVFRRSHKLLTLGLRSGYAIPPGDGEELIDLITDGTVDFYNLNVTKPQDRSGPSAVMQLRGRDTMARLLDTQFNLIYRNGPSPEVTDGALTTPEVNGRFSAAQIFGYICEQAGLLPQWELPDYVINDSFTAVGRPIDIIRNLVRPFALLEAIKTDIFTIGKTLIARQRQPLGWVAAPLDTFSVVDARINSVQIRKFQTDPIGLISLQGMRLDAQETPDDGSGKGNVPVLTWADPAPITWPEALGPMQLNASANVAGTFDYNPDVGESLDPGDRTLSASFLPDDPNWKSGTVKTTLVVLKQPVNLKWSTGFVSQEGASLEEEVFNATATDSNGDPVPGTYTYSPGPGASLKAGSYVITLTFRPSDSTHYESGGTLTATLQVLPKTVPTITWTPATPIPPDFPLDETVLNASASEPGEFAYTPGEGTVLSPGPRTLKVKFTPEAPTSTTATAFVQITVLESPGILTPVITWATPAPITEGTPLSATQLNASADVPGTFAYNPSTGAVLKAGTHSLKTTFTPEDAETYKTVTARVSINVIGTPPPSTPVITWDDPAAIYYTTPLDETQLNADAGVPGTYDYSPGEGAILTVGNHTLHVRFTPDDPDTYREAVKTVVLEILPLIAPEIDWQPLPLYDGEALSTEQLNAVASAPGTYVYSPDEGTVLTAGTRVLKLRFTPFDSPPYKETTAETTLTVLPKKTPVINWPNPAPIVEGQPLTGTQLNAQADVDGTYVYAPPEGNIPSAGVNKILRVTLTPYDPTFAEGNATALLDVIRPKISWSRPADLVVGHPLGGDQLNATANVPGEITYNPPAGTTFDDVGVQELQATLVPSATPDRFVIRSVALRVVEEEDEPETTPGYT